MPLPFLSKKTSCKFWHPPVRQNYKSDTGCIHGRKCFFRPVEAGVKGSVALRKESTPFGCVSQEDSCPSKSILREQGQLGSKHTVKFSKGTWHQREIWERKSPSRTIFQKCEPHERGLCARRLAERTQDETLQQDRCARRVE